MLIMYARALHGLQVHMAKPHTTARADESGSLGNSRDPSGAPRYDDRYGRGGGRGGAQDRYAGEAISQCLSVQQSSPGHQNYAIVSRKTVV